MTYKKTLLSLVIAALAAGCSPDNTTAPTVSEPAPVATPSDAERCAALQGQRFGDATIVAATAQAAEQPVTGTLIQAPMQAPGTGKPVQGVPAFCRVVGDIQPEAGSSIRFEVWLPESQRWDGRLYGAGNGGFAGTLHYQDLATAIQAGQAAVSTTTGHDGQMADASWAEGRPELIRDYAWRGIHLSNVAARAIIDRYFGRGPDYAYFASCSNGGRQALMEASRFPDDYDGIIAGAPAARWTDLMMSMIWHTQSQAAEGADIRGEQAVLLEQEVLRQCDSSDGQQDGLVADPRQCAFDFQPLACGASDSADCFTPPQLEALKKIVAGPPKDSNGMPQGYGFTLSGAEQGPMPYLGWDGWIFGRAPMPPPSGAVFPAQSLRYLTSAPVSDVAGFDFSKHPSLLREQWGELMDAQPDLSAFFNRGGKLILWHGWADAAIPPQLTLDFHQEILEKSGAKAKDAMQFYMVPGVQHCTGGTGPGSFGQEGAPMPGDTAQNDMVAALQGWVEQGNKPGPLVGKMQSAQAVMTGKVEMDARERLICTWPQQAVLTEGADPDKASSYRCQ